MTRMRTGGDVNIRESSRRTLEPQLVDSQRSLGG